MLSNQTILIISPTLLLAGAAKVDNLGSNKGHLLSGNLRLLALPPLALIMAITILGSERPPLRCLLALPFSNLCLLIMLDHRKIRLIIVIIKFLIIFLIARLKNAIMAIIARMARIL